ncbi:peptide chain release factor 2 [Verrucomicrobia bacterium]|nr:peptide chain release factor 2 [Verrucomicrobiota bacterium]MDA7533046.1 peptide chain release factor 2 [Verrucomicrobiota bacterium]MDA7670766.1 peptide chain release factor 2 [Verrucomicrobiota bacterium]MDB4690358.1 peptide chain release factor 2 [Verrucomicrobiota bacterium]MDB4778546.1 peptide chain release factor 2 [Verrucomicrobiota bacterium]
MFEQVKEELVALREKLSHLRRFLDEGKLDKRLIELEAQMSREDFWNDRDAAQKLTDESASIRRKLDPLKKGETRLQDIEVMLELGVEEPESVQETIEADLTEDISAFRKEYDALELSTLLTGPHDANNCILSINAGAGGTESCDWADMLMRMYQRWGESRGWKVDVTDILEGDTAGIKSAVMLISGENAYGFCKAERGVHRLVRISPFDSNKRRHTSFASVDVIAEIAETEQESIPPTEFRVDTFRSGGKGGQNVNKVETAVRITHLESGLSVACQTQRSQHQNRATAMNLLLSRIFALKQDQQKKDMERFYGEKGSVSWGNQIRSYVFQPYRMVKDLRTGIDTSDVQGVMDGKLNDFVDGWLRAGCPLKKITGIEEVDA